jgi:uncharacterized membrane protein YqjE
VREILLSSIVADIIRMNLMQIVMSVVFALSAGYIIWCLYKATRYMREHPDEFRWSDDDERRKKVEGS